MRKPVEDEEIFKFLAWYFRDQQGAWVLFHRGDTGSWDDCFLESNWDFDEIYKGTRGYFFNKHAWKKNEKGEIVQ